MQVAILLLNYNGKKDTLECLHSLSRLSYPKHQIILADNGSSDNCLLEVEKLYPRVLLLNNKENLGFAGGYNRAISFALDKGFDACLLLNNDTTVDPHLLDAFMEGSTIHPNALLGAKIYLYSKPDVYDHFGGIWDEKRASFILSGFREKEDLTNYSSYFPLDYLCGCALFVKREVFEKIGFLDERFFLFWEESDFCFRAKKAGFDLLVCPQAKVWHKVSASFTGGKPHVTYFYFRNRLLWVEKNFSGIKRMKLFFAVLLPETLRLLKHASLRKLQSQIERFIFLKKPSIQKEEKLLEYKAAITGTLHYLQRKFFNAPSWIYKKRS